MAWRKEKNGEKSPWGKCLTRPVPNCRGHSGFWSVPENFCVFLPNRKAERQRPFGTGLVRHCPQGLFSPFFSFLCAIFPARLDFLSPPLSAPGSSRMYFISVTQNVYKRPKDWKYICCSYYFFFFSGNFYFSFVSTSLAYITMPKNKRRTKITWDKKLTTTCIYSL